MTEARLPPDGDTVLVRYCDFCGKRQEQVQLLMVGPRADICDECIDLCAEIVAEKRARGNPNTPDGETQ